MITHYCVECAHHGVTCCLSPDDEVCDDFVEITKRLRIPSTDALLQRDEEEKK